MRSRWTTPIVLAAVALLVAGAWAPFAAAQAVTTGRLSGRVVAEADAAALPGAQVHAVHLPTGTRYDTLTRPDGRFDILNVRVGGPYEVTARMDGFVETVRSEVYVALGEERALEIAMPIETIEETVTVVGEQSPIINPSATGVANNVSVQTIEALPVVQRSMQEIAKLSPYFATYGDNGENTVVAVAGRNNRYNNIQIDGAVNNDVFGLAGTGTPGGQAETQPISYDAIQELQLLVSPYDVRQGGFSGGGINAITRSGTNAWAGSVYWYNRDEGLVGDGPFDSEIGAFAEDEYGGRVGGPLVRDKAFFFVSGEVAELERPTGFAADGSAPQNFRNPGALSQMRDILLNSYGYDPGGLGEFNKSTPSDKLFGRVDYNVAENHQLVLRHNWVDATNDIIRPNTGAWDFASWNYNFDSETNSTVGQLNSVLSSNLFNELRITNQTIRDRRYGDEPFPAVLVIFNDGTSATAGVENFSTANALNQDIIEISDEVNWIRGNHQLTLGTANELMEFENLFIRNSLGNYRFESLADFERGWASQYEFSFSATGNPNEPAKFEVQKLGFYGGDRWQVNPSFNLVYGLRADVPYFPDEPSYNPQIDQIYGFRTDEVADGNVQWSPRVGFNWDISGDGSQQLRGGVGYFAGRPPYVWISNQYGNTGVDFFRFTARVNGPIGPGNHIAFRPDPFDQYTDPTELGAQVATNEVNIIDPDFEYPSVLRASLGYDRELGFFGLIGSAEVLWSEVDQDIHYQNLNLRPSGQTAFDGRPRFTRLDPRLGDTILLTNTDKGDTLNATLKVERPFRDGWYAMAAYSYGESNAVNPGTSSQAISNWRFLPTKGDPNQDVNTRSQFEIEDRFIANTSYTFDYGTGWGTTVSLFYNAQSGQPYSLLFGTDVNGDGQFNDLLFVPASCNDVIVVNGSCDVLQSLFNAVEGTKPGEIVDRNHATAPWVHRVDLKLAQKIPVARYGLEVTLDLLNLANLVDSDSGVVEYVPFGTYQAVRFNGIDAATGRPIYQLNFNDPDQRFVIDDLRSRWQAKLGIRFNF